MISTLYQPFVKCIKRRTLVFLDQRGTGKSEPLDCGLPDSDGVEIPVEALQTCVNELPRSASWYQTASFGCGYQLGATGVGVFHPLIYMVFPTALDLGLTIMQQYPKTVRSAVLDGVVPFQKSIGGDFGGGVQRALEQVFVDCAATEDCHKAFPDLTRGL